MLFFCYWPNGDSAVKGPMGGSNFDPLTLWEMAITLYFRSLGCERPECRRGWSHNGRREARRHRAAGQIIAHLSRSRTILPVMSIAAATSSSIVAALTSLPQRALCPRKVASVEVRPRRSIAPVLKKVSVELLTIALPLELRR